MLIYPENEWNIYDERGVMYPWYVHPALEWIEKNIPKDVNVLEIGGGNSTLWWRENAKEVYTIDLNVFCVDTLQCNYSTYESLPQTIDAIENNFDVVIVDTDGDRESYVLNAFEKCSKYFILDNWQQSEVMIYSDEVVDFLYKNTKEQHVFKQENHKDWKTAIFIK